MSINSLIGALTPQGSGLNQLLDTINQAAGGGKGNPDLNSLLGLSLGVGGAAINLGPSPSNVSNFNANFGIDNLFSSTAGLGSMPSFVSSILTAHPTLPHQHLQRIRWQTFLAVPLAWVAALAARIISE